MARCAAGWCSSELIDHDVEESAPRSPGGRRHSRASSLLQGEEDVAAVEAAGRCDDPVVGGVELGELGLGGARACPRRAPRRALGSAGPSRPPSAHRSAREVGQQARRVAADLVLAQRQLVQPVEQHRQPLGGAEHPKNGSSPAASECSRSSRSPSASQVPIQSSSRASSRASTRSRSRGGGPRRGEDQHALRCRCPRRPAAPSRAPAASVLPVPALPSSSSGPSPCSDGPLAVRLRRGRALTER